MRRGLVPLVRQGRRGPAVDLDAMLLVLMEQYCKGTAAAAAAAVSAMHTMRFTNCNKGCGHRYRSPCRRLPRQPPGAATAPRRRLQRRSCNTGVRRRRRWRRRRWWALHPGHLGVDGGGGAWSTGCSSHDFGCSRGQTAAAAAAWQPHAQAHCEPGPASRHCPSAPFCYGLTRAGLLRQWRLLLVSASGSNSGSRRGGRGRGWRLPLPASHLGPAATGGRQRRPAAGPAQPAEGIGSQQQRRRRWQPVSATCARGQRSDEGSVCTCSH